MDSLTPAMLAPYVLRASTGGAPDTSDGSASMADVAREFEAQFLYQLLQQMRTSMSWGEEEDGFGAETLGATMDMALATNLSASGGIGLAKLFIESAARGTVNAGAVVTALEKSPAAAAALVAAPGASLRSGERVEPGASVPVEPGAAPIESTGPEGASLAALFDARVTSAFGWRSDPFDGARKFHGGVDIAMAYGVEVPAAEEGTVVAAGEQGRYGQTVVLEHPSGARTRYAHLSEIGVRVGQMVEAGDPLGRAGRSGAATGPHLHFEVIVDSQRMDPLSAQARASIQELSRGAD